jgi:hypothetical protein
VLLSVWVPDREVNTETLALLLQAGHPDLQIDLVASYSEPIGDLGLEALSGVSVGG